MFILIQINNTWLVTFKKNYIPFLDLFFLFRFFFHFNFLLLKTKSLFLTIIINSFFKFENINYFKHVLAKPSFKFGLLTPNNLLAKKFRYKRITSFTSNTFNKPLIFSKTNTYIYILNLFFLINNLSYSSILTPHANFRLYGLVVLKNRALILDPKLFFQKWHHIYLFFTNLFYFHKMPLVFSSKFFKKETLSLNWYFHKFSFTSWKYISDVFTFYVNIYSKKIISFFKRFKKLNYTFALLLDIQYHFKFLYYFNRFKWFLIAIIPANINPWSVTFALPVMENSFFVQFFFIKFLLLIKKRNSYENYRFNRKLWDSQKLKLF